MRVGCGHGSKGKKEEMRESRHGRVRVYNCGGGVGWNWDAVQSRSMMLREKVLGVVVCW